MVLSPKSSQLQALQILTNDDEVENWRFSSFLFAVMKYFGTKNVLAKYFWNFLKNRSKKTRPGYPVAVLKTWPSVFFRIKQVDFYNWFKVQRHLPILWHQCNIMMVKHCAFKSWNSKTFATLISRFMYVDRALYS